MMDGVSKVVKLTLPSCKSCHCHHHLQTFKNNWLKNVILLKKLSSSMQPVLHVDDENDDLDGGGECCERLLQDMQRLMRLLKKSKWI